LPAAALWIDDPEHRMVCKFHAAMYLPVSLPFAPSRSLPRLAVLTLALALALAAPVRAEKADRLKPLNVEADLPGKIDLLNQFVVFNGNVVVTKGTMTIRAARIEVRESADGYHTAVAFGSPTQHATFRQKRDEPDEYIEGDAERLEYDGKSDVIRFVNNASVRRLRGATQADEISGNLVTYDSTSEVFNVSGGAPATAANPGGRVRAVLVPREGTAAAAEARAAAAASGVAPLRSAPAIREPK
jgi:lipopolysaccharide export system protein LptA